VTWVKFRAGFAEAQGDDVTGKASHAKRTEPAMSQVTTPTEAGWLPDPSGRYEWRYWDGGWTNRVANTAPVGAATAPVAPDPPAFAPVPAHPPAPALAPAPLPAPDLVAAPAPASSPTLTARDAVPRVPFGADPAPGAGAVVAAPPAKRRRSVWAVVTGFFRSLADQPESYASELARQPLPPDARGERLVATAPGNYGHAMIVAFAAVGIVVGAYLPWLSGTVGLAPFHRSGFDDGLGLGYTIGAMALALSAILSVQMRAFRWLTVILSFVITGFVVRDVLHSYDVMQDMNRYRTVDANVSWGLWIMIVAAAIAMIGAVRLSEDEKIG
jgi:hypothetical protein